MGNIYQYLLTLITSSIICSITIGITARTGKHATIIKLLCSIYMLIVIISPWMDIRIQDFASYLDGLNYSAQSIVEGSAEASNKQRKEIIKTQIEEYIYDKAEHMGAQPDVEVQLSETEPYAPVSVSISGKTSPYVKRRLQQIITDDLNIPEVNQLWN